MFSYRHGFHAGNHADVLKHTVLIACLRHLTTKETPLWVIDTHAGAGLYRLDSDQASTSGEATEGLLRLAAAAPGLGDSLAPALADYLGLVGQFNRERQWRTYPGSPFVAHTLLRHEARDKLKLFELHPSDGKALTGHVEQMEAGRMVTVTRQDGFEGLRPLLPPPSRRALVLVDPSYEIKSDYVRVQAMLRESLQRFATGCYMIWYPLVPRPESHDLPRKLKAMTNTAGKPWLHAQLAVGLPPAEPGVTRKPGLAASGVFIVNPPYTLKAQLQAALPQLVQVLGRGRGQGQVLETGG